MKDRSYNIWAAFLVELIRQLIQHKPALANNKWLAMIASYLMDDWIEWRTERTMAEVDRQARAIVAEWDAQEAPRALYSESEPDGSEAQGLLGGEMRIKGSWVDPEG